MIGIDQFLDKGCRVRVHTEVRGAPDVCVVLGGAVDSFCADASVIVRIGSGEMLKCRLIDVERVVEPCALPEKPIAPPREQ